MARTGMLRSKKQSELNEIIRDLSRCMRTGLASYVVSSPNNMTPGQAAAWDRYVTWCYRHAGDK